MYILAIETSCDETSAAVIKDGKTVLANIVHSQIDVFAEFGGVVPEICSRNHVLYIKNVINRALETAQITPKDLEYVAVTKGPGLIGSLLIGINAAQAFALVHDLPLIGINHLHGHIYGAFIENNVSFPALALLISGGHSELIVIKDHNDFKIIGQTMDDACGEAFDKVAKIINLGYPGGPVIDKLAKLGNPNAYNFPRPLINEKSYDFSFSGLKTAVLTLSKTANYKVEDVCSSFQQAVIDILTKKVLKALDEFGLKNLIICGGVACNSAIRQTFVDLSQMNGFNLAIPSIKYCQDNAAMIAMAAYYQTNHEDLKKDYIIIPAPSLDL